MRLPVNDGAAPVSSILHRLSRCKFNNAAEGMGDHRIEDANLANDKLCEAVEEGELRHSGGIESSAE